ncbi:AmmeMemoRadiSam system protein B [Halochromatium glycolicum]|uniref:MEMO1 family protein CKO40_08660 n=1 Tax=Halochromatium glycolicum TaxID=85075 RepID=A0AAJ0U4C0_9GAMM|nr:AmmeMemoRadiSam system protein B [Halochromatium glycolicum]MBK1704605.1 AmmeMemoRadiSam system protein B [Halochromatium glycolicum]
MTNPSIQRPAVAGMFYTGDPVQLNAEVRGFIAAGRQGAQGRGAANTGTGDGPSTHPRALIAPHAGYVFSGAVAGSAYAAIADDAARFDRVVLLGPAHRVPVRGLAASSASAFETPLGRVPVDQDEVERMLAAHPWISRLDAAFDNEHCIEVQLPFLQVLLERFSLVPLLVGAASAQQVAAILEPHWDRDATLIVISSDLSHYLDYASAQALDRKTSEAIRTLHPERLAPEQACGHDAIAGLLQLAAARGATGRVLDLRNSGDTAGPRDRVVGYGAYAFS